MIKSTTLVLVALASCFSFACSSEPTVDLGDGAARQGTLGQNLSDYAASWSGHAEAFKFVDGSDLVRLALDADGRGFLELGDSPELPPLDVAAPVTAGYGDLVGYRYPVEATVEGERLRLRVSRLEPYRAWCEAQTPIEMVDELNDGHTYYDCAPRGGVVPQGDGSCQYISKWDEVEPTSDTWNCEAFELCGGTCSCEAEGCSIAERSADDLTIDAMLEDEESLTGTWRHDLFGVSERVTIRLTKQP